MGSSLCSIKDSAIFIEDKAAATNYESGGLLGILMDSYREDNRININRVLENIKNTLTTGGFVVAITFALVILLISVILVIFREKIRNLAHDKFIRLKKYKIKVHVLVYLLTIFVGILALSFLICSFIANSSLHNNLSSDGNDKNEDGFFHNLKEALVDIRTYVSTFSSSAKDDSKPIIDSIIINVKEVIGGALKAFIENFMKSVGVDEFLLYAKDLNNSVSSVIISMKQAEQLYKIVDTEINEIRVYYNYFMRKFNQTLTECPADFKVRCQAVLTALTQPTRTAVDMNKVNIKAVTSFIFLMDATNITVDMLSDQLANGEQQVGDMIQDISKKFDENVNVKSLILKMTDNLFDEMDTALSKVSADIPDIPYDVEKYVKIGETVRMTITTIFLVIFLVIIIYTTLLAISHFSVTIPCLSCSSNRCIYISQGFVIFCLVLWSVIFIGLSFLVGGYLRTQVCRYIHIDKNDTSGIFVLDSHGNDLINSKWHLLTETLESNPLPFPLPRPKNVLQGITSECAANKSISEALNWNDKIDPSGLINIETTFLDTGKDMMHKALGDIEASALLPRGIDNIISQARQIVDIFMKDVDYQSSVNELGKEILNVDTNGVISKVLNLATDIRTTESEKSSDLTELANDFWINSLSKISEVSEEKASLQKYFETIQKFRYFGATIDLFQISMNNLSSTMMDAEKMEAIADANFNEHIATKLSNAKKILSVPLKDIINKLGPCRLVYDALFKVEKGICKVVLDEFNALWFCMFLSEGFLLAFLFLIIAVTAKNPADTTVNSSKIESNDSMPKSAMKYSHFSASLDNISHNSYLSTTSIETYV